MQKQYEVKNFDNLLGMNGFSDDLLKNHFTLYQGYVANVNKTIEALSNFLQSDKTASSEYAEIKRRFGWEFNGMRLHEYYFENLSKEENTVSSDGALYQKIVENFGSFENWEKDFRATGAMRGIGWTALVKDGETGNLFNVWVNEHDMGYFVKTKVILIMDVFEHAFALDYGIKRADYINAFFANINWNVVEKRIICGCGK